MAVSTFDLFKIGIGPSSSHTVGPMRASARFVQRWLVQEGNLQACTRIKAELYGSLALTGKGHGSDKAVLLGLEGQWPHLIDPDHIEPMLARIRKGRNLLISAGKSISFDEKTDLVFNKRQKLPFHSNGMRFTAFDAEGAELCSREYYSVGGGFVVNQDEAAQDRITADTTVLPYPFKSGAELIAQCENNKLTIAELMWANERVWRTDAQIESELDAIWQAMQNCLARGTRISGVLPGGLKVARRAPLMMQELL
ncbi:MAG: L-serine ammonia-lyase, iron-sulfur-dependent, subunit alpha, partial [Arenimonas sp.]|nr:L-serine ammonia-lyase, iron-sulfur-dependent, subunit alpha [Arenimonas sp.]